MYGNIITIFTLILRYFVLTFPVMVWYATMVAIPRFLFLSGLVIFFVDVFVLRCRPRCWRRYKCSSRRERPFIPAAPSVTSRRGVPPSRSRMTTSLCCQRQPGWRWCRPKEHSDRRWWWSCHNTRILSVDLYPPIFFRYYETRLYRTL